jgi:hypothetical protein
VVRERLAKVRPRTVVAIAWLALFLYGFPGQMIPDAFEHLIEARANFYTDASPPVFTLLFDLSDWMFGGQVLVFLLQITAFVAGAYLTFRRLGLAQAHWWTLGFCIFPPVIAPLAPVWKDALLPGLLLLGFACVLDQRRWVRLLALVALWGAIAIRYNAFAAVAPIVVLLFEWRPGLHWVKRYAISTAAWVAITFAAYQANALLTDREMHLYYASLALFDIAGTVQNSSMTDAELAPLMEGTGFRRGTEPTVRARITKMYRTRNFYYLVEEPDPTWRVPLRGIEPQTPETQARIAHAWSVIVGGHKGAYLLHRARVFREVLALAGKTRAYWAVVERNYAYPITAQQVGVAVSASPLQRGATAVYTWIWEHTPLFEPWVYFALCLILLPFARKHRDVLALLLSGVAIELTLFFLASSPDYRYSHWMVLTAILSWITLIARRNAS